MSLILFLSEKNISKKSQDEDGIRTYAFRLEAQRAILSAGTPLYFKVCIMHPTQNRVCEWLEPWTVSLTLYRLSYPGFLEVQQIAAFTWPNKIVAFT